MFFQTGDIIIFRKKDYNHLMKSIKTLNLDNDIGIIVKDFKTFTGFYLLQIEKEVVLSPISILKSHEYYNYRQFDSITNQEIMDKMVNSQSTMDLINKLYGVDTYNKIRKKLSLKESNLVGVTNFDKNYINPYALTYLITPILEYFIIKKYFPNNNYKFIYFIFLIFGMLSGRIMSKLHGNTNGMQFSGAMITFFGLILLLEYFYNYSSLKILDMLSLVIGFRIFFTRFASWLINDIDVKVDPKTGAPYDTLLYESIFEGIIPSLFCWILKDKVKDGHLLLIWVFNYAFFRIIIENFKNNYHNSCFVLTQGQIDTIPLIFLSIWIYFTRKNNRYSYQGYFIILILYLDLCFRAQDYSQKKKTILNIDMIIKTEKNKGFVNNLFDNLKVDQKLIINSGFLFLNTYLTKDYERKLLLLLTGSLNLGERYFSGHVTDYFKLSYKNLHTLNFNLSDLLFFLN